MNPKIEKTEKEYSWLNAHDLNELIETTNMDILPKYNLIPENNLLTVRKVKILTLPFDKYIEKTKAGKEINKNLNFMIISDNDIKYSVEIDSLAFQRSLIGLAIKLCEVKTKDDISKLDLSVVLDKLVGLKREKFVAKGFTQAPLKFFLL